MNPKSLNSFFSKSPSPLLSNMGRGYSASSAPKKSPVVSQKPKVDPRIAHTNELKNFIANDPRFNGNYSFNKLKDMRKYIVLHNQFNDYLYIPKKC